MLRQATANDLDFLYILYMHPDINNYLLYEQMDLKTFVVTIQELLQKGELYIYESDNNCIGMCKLVNQQHRNSHCLYVGGIAIHPNYFNKGYGNKLMQLIINFAKNNGKKRLELTVATENLTAINLYKKNGFEQEGILKKYTYLKSKDQYIDEAVMACYL
jgi:RimJ/RimL family protein N-acetyltransferase